MQFCSILRYLIPLMIGRDDVYAEYAIYASSHG